MGSLLSRCACCTCTSCKQTFLQREPSFSEILSGIGELEVPVPPKQYSWDIRPKVNPADYTISDLTNGEQRVKRPGEVNGQQFIIKNCSNCSIYLFDFSNSVTIDDCSDCLIVLGPVQGSIFLRDTKNSTLVCSSSQLRLRDCQNIHLFVGIESDPIIEASLNIIVGPYFLNYKGIYDHFKSANLDKFKSTKWSEIYDFTPNDLTPNWSRYDRDKHHPSKYICLPNPPEHYSDLEISVGDKYLSFVPVTHYMDDLHDRPKWRKHDVTFSLEPGQEDIGGLGLEEFMEKFYKDKFILGQSQNPQGPTALLCDIQCSRNQYTFTYYQD